jgi:hypothetical protein
MPKTIRIKKIVYLIRGHNKANSGDAKSRVPD